MCTDRRTEVFARALCVPVRGNRGDDCDSYGQRVFTHQSLIVKERVLAYLRTRASAGSAARPNARRVIRSARHAVLDAGSTMVEVTPSRDIKSRCKHPPALHHVGFCLHVRAAVQAWPHELASCTCLRPRSAVLEAARQASAAHSGDILYMFRSTAFVVVGAQPTVKRGITNRQLLQARPCTLKTHCWERNRSTAQFEQLI